MTLKDQKIYAQKHFSSEYESLSQGSYPEEYTLIACEWLNKWGGRPNVIRWCICQWKEFVNDKEKINQIQDINDLVHTVTEYRLHGKRNPNRKELGLSKFRNF